MSWGRWQKGQCCHGHQGAERSWERPAVLKGLLPTPLTHMERALTLSWTRLLAQECFVLILLSWLEETESPSLRMRCRPRPTGSANPNPSPFCPFQWLSPSVPASLLLSRSAVISTLQGGMCLLQPVPSDNSSKASPSQHLIPGRGAWRMPHGLLWDEALLTLISLMDASVSAEMDVSPLPLREEVPPREAKVAADRLETVRAPYNHTHINCSELSFPYESWVCSFPSFFFFFYTHETSPCTSKLCTFD